MKKGDPCPVDGCTGAIVGPTKLGKLYCYVCGYGEMRVVDPDTEPMPEVKRANTYANEDFYDPDWRA